MDKTYRQLIQEATHTLETHGKEGHAIQAVFLRRKNWDKMHFLLNLDQLATREDQLQVAQDIERLLADYPPQYLTGVEEFYGRLFQVTEDTLIPRPETEELVQLCLSMNDQTKPLHVMDIGTGTGAIAISLKAEAPNWNVHASDLSPKALQVAQQNAQRLEQELCFHTGDTLTPVLAHQFDIIVSNPPYIAQNEWEVMDASVRLFEPKMALFAEHEGLAIYEKIAKQAPLCLKPEGQLFLEIGYLEKDAVIALFQQAFPMKKVEAKKDLFGNDRMIVVY